MLTKDVLFVEVASNKPVGKPRSDVEHLRPFPQAGRPGLPSPAGSACSGAGEVLLPLVDLDVQLASATQSRIRGDGDLTLGFGLQWAPKKIGKGVFVHRAMIDVGVPTGKYSDSRPVNLGNHFVVVDPYYAFTYEWKKVELSTRLHYLWNSTNNDPFVGFGIKDVQLGQAFHINYATSYELFKNVRLGFNGYWLQQLTDHEINGVAIPNSKAHCGPWPRNSVWRPRNLVPRE